MKNERQIGIFIGYANMLTNFIVVLLYTPFMLNSIGQSEYGLYSLASSIVAYLSVLDMGFGNSMIRFVSRNQARNDGNEKVNGMFLILYSIIGLIAFIIGMVILSNASTLFSNSLSVEELKKLKIIMGILIATISISFPLSVFSSYAVASEKFIFLKILALIQSIIVPLTMLPLLYSGFKSIALVIVTNAYTILFSIITMYFCFKKLKMKISFDVSIFGTETFKEVLIYSFYIFLNLMVDSVFNNTDQVILGIFSGTVAISIYEVASKIIKINQTFSTTISGVFFPKIAKIAEEENSKEKLSNIFIQVSRIQLYVMLLILSGFVIYGRMFIDLWVGSQYIESYFIVLLIMVPSVVPLTQNLGISILQAENKHKFRSIVYFGIAILNILVSIPLAKLYGGIGAAIGSALAIIAGQIFTMNIYYWKVIGIDIVGYWKFFIKIALQIAIVSFLNIRLLKYVSPSYTSLIICATLYTVCYLIIIYFNMNFEEKEYVKNFMKKLCKARR